MLKSLKRAVGGVPVVGPAIKKAYLTLFTAEGRVRTIRKGLLEGVQYRHYRWSTPREDLVESNWDDLLQTAFTAEIKGKRRFFDVGANWGFYVLLAGKYRDKGCEVVAFEPHPQSAAELQTQVVLNGMSGDTRVVQAAVSDTVGTIEFADTGSAIGQMIASVDKDKLGQRMLKVPTMTLDGAAEQFGMPDLVKLDVEGAENLVMAGATKVFTEGRPTLLVEIHGEERSGPFYDFMAKFDYRCFGPDGAEVTDRAYHHHMICRPA
ncbi:MAG: FkbM family methyltransferase [Phycisphaerae bacterium]